MRTLRSWGAAVALWSGALAATGAQAAQTRAAACITPPAAEALMLSIAPEALGKVAELCTPVLPASAFLRRSISAMAGRYAIESEAAWPRAKGAMGTMMGEMGGLAESAFTRPLMANVVAELIAKDLKTRDCRAIDRIMGLIEPLPPRNAAALVVTIIQLAQKPGKKSSFNICADPRLK
ncbi:MAG: hypothetical protein V4659_12890 [Pseudomonadota bacterium]